MASEQAMALYRKLNSSGTAITNSNWREWDRLASSAMKMPDFTPAGQSESLHDLANEIGIEIQALKSRASRPGAPDTFAVEDRFYFGKGRKERFADDYAAANRRVQGSSELRKYARIIMSDDWREGADHWKWVATAPTSEIVSWAKEIADSL